MNIQIRGTSGSGKSTVMRLVMAAFPQGCTRWEPAIWPGRKQPLYYHRGDIAVLGHYETACGGCDTIGSAKAVYNTVTIILKDYKIVLCEGLLLSEDSKWSKLLPDLRVVFLTTSLEQCLKNIETRRREAGNEKPLNPKNTANRIAVIERARVKLTEAGALCRRATSDQAPGIVMKWISEY